MVIHQPSILEHFKIHKLNLIHYDIGLVHLNSYLKGGYPVLELNMLTEIKNNKLFKKIVKNPNHEHKQNKKMILQVVTII